MRLVTYFVAACALIAACVFGGEGVRTGVRVWRMIFGNRARGAVMSHQERLTRRGNRTLRFPVIEFVATAGQTLRFTDAVTAGKWAIGRECVVAYAPANPAGTAVAIRPSSVIGLLLSTFMSLSCFAGVFLLLSGGSPG